MKFNITFYSARNLNDSTLIGALLVELEISRMMLYWPLVEYDSFVNSVPTIFAVFAVDLREIFMSASYLMDARRIA